MFLSELHATPADGYKWRLLKPLTYQTPDNCVIEVPAGFVTDLASIPRLFRFVFSVHGSHTPAAVVHDYLYSVQQACGKRIGRKSADKVFYHAMRELGVNRAKAWTMYAGVRTGGWWPWGKNKS